LLSILERSSDAICIVEGISGQLLYANRTLVELLGDRARSDANLVISDILEISGVAPDCEIQAILDIAASQPVPVPARFIASSLASVPLEISICRLPCEGEQLYGIVIPVRGASGSAATKENQGRTDPLTGLRDRAFLTSRLEDLLGGERAADQRFAVLFIDLDNFKQVNDAFGHLVGDSVLQEVARRLTSCVRARDHVVRYGGDEFVVLAEQLATADDIDGIIDRIHRMLANPIDLPEGTIVLTLSIGVAQASAEYRSPNEVLAAADRAMYASKRSRT
jgi:diguanylate cyclase (GGDEF)-like protein